MSSVLGLPGPHVTGVGGSGGRTSPCSAASAERRQLLEPPFRRSCPRGTPTSGPGPGSRSAGRRGWTVGEGPQWTTSRCDGTGGGRAGSTWTPGIGREFSTRPPPPSLSPPAVHPCGLWQGDRAAPSPGGRLIVCQSLDTRTSLHGLWGGLPAPRPRSLPTPASSAVLGLPATALPSSVLQAGSGLLTADSHPTAARCVFTFLPLPQTLVPVRGKLTSGRLPEAALWDSGRSCPSSGRAGLARSLSETLGACRHRRAPGAAWGSGAAVAPCNVDRALCLRKDKGKA